MPANNSIATVGPGDLISTTWGNSVVLELNTWAVKVDGSHPMTGTLLVTGTPSLKLRQSGNQPSVVFETTAAAEIGHIKAFTTNVEYTSTSTSGFHQFNVGTTERFRVDNTGAGVTGALTSTGRVSGLAGWFAGNTEQVVLIDTTGGNTAFVGFYGNGTLAAKGTRAGNVGFGGSTSMQLRNELSGGALNLVTTGTGGIAATTGAGGGIGLTTSAGAGAITLTTAAGGLNLTSGAGAITLLTGSGDINVHAGAGGEILFTPGNVYQGKMTGTVLLWGKAAVALGNAGIEMQGAGGIFSTTDVAGARNLYCRHASAAAADNQAFIQFLTSSQIGAITQNGSAAVQYLTTSDSRLKNDLGLIRDGVTRLKLLRPRRFTWKADSDRVEYEGFFADEVASVVPRAVRGEPDDVDDAGEPVPQMYEPASLIPLTIAALLDVIDRVESLEDR